MLEFKHTKVGNVETYIFNEEITPLYLKYQGNIKKITKIPNEFFKIKEWRVKVVNNILVELTILDCFHPNASHEPSAQGGFKLDFNYPPALSWFCLPDSLKNKDLGNDYDINHYTRMFIDLLKTYNYDSSYWTRWDGFETVDYQVVMDNRSNIKPYQKRKPASFSETVKTGFNTVMDTVKEDGIKALGGATTQFLNSGVARIPKNSSEAKLQFNYFLNVLEDTLLRELEQRGKNAKRNQEG